MDAAPFLIRIAAAFKKVKLEAVMIGNAAAALQGAPVTTLDIDFCYRSTPLNDRKVRAFAEALEADIGQPFAPASEVYRIERKAEGLQIDIMDAEQIGLKFASLRSRAAEVLFDGCPLLIASLEDIIASKKRANRPKDHAALYAIELTWKDRQEKGGA